MKITRMPQPEGLPTSRILYKTSEKLVFQYKHQDIITEYLVLSLGRLGDTCVFPADTKGFILDYLGVGYRAGPTYLIIDSKAQDRYVESCVKAHLETDGVGYSGPKNWEEENGL